MKETSFADFSTAWTVLALLVLVAACTNLASLFGASVADRGRELALRMALGSSRWRLVRQLLTEALLVSLIGGAAGLVTADLLLGALSRWNSPYGRLEVSLDARVYFAGVAFTLGSALLFGLVPARQAWRSSPSQIIKGGRADARHPRRFALRDLLLGVQITICTLLVTASLVAASGMARMLRVPLGFEPRGAMLAEIDLSQSGGSTRDKRKDIIQALRGTSGITAAGAVNLTPMTGGLHGIPVFRPGTTEFNLRNSVATPYVFSMSPGYLDTAGTRLVGGRDVSWHDTANTPAVAIVNEVFARRMWGQAPPIGQRFILWGKLTQVVGVSENGKYHDITESPQPTLYVPFSQSEQRDTIFVVRSRLAPARMAAAIARTLSGIEPNVAIAVRSWSGTLNGELFPARAATLALGVMGLLAAMLAVTGISGMAAYSVSRRMKELGIRVALGAGKTHVMSAAVGRPLMLLVVGSVLGLLAGIFASRLLEQIVYRANPLDPVVVGGAVLTMALLGVAASAIPARRALAVDPAKLMRED